MKPAVNDSLKYSMKLDGYDKKYPHNLPSAISCFSFSHVHTNVHIHSFIIFQVPICILEIVRNEINSNYHKGLTMI